MIKINDLVKYTKDNSTPIYGIITANTGTYYKVTIVKQIYYNSPIIGNAVYINKNDNTYEIIECDDLENVLYWVPVSIKLEGVWD